MNRPREKRLRKRLPVRIWGMDTAGKLFNVGAHTVDITAVGACIEGAFAYLQRGAVVGVECGRSRARFRVVWIGQPGSRRQDQIGIRCIEAKYIWGVPLERKMEEEPTATQADLAVL